MNKTNKTFAVLAVICVLFTALMLALRGPLPGTNQPDKPSATKRAEKTTAPPPSVVTFMAVGDNLIHKPIYNQAKARAKNGVEYDFTPVYDGVRDIIARADLAMINQESPIATAIAAPSSYPMFNSPMEVGDAVYELGFRAVGLANNHMLDKREAGVTASLDYWASKPGVCAFGAYRDAEDFAQPHTLEVNGITFAFVGATFSYNGLRQAQGSQQILPLLEQEELLRVMITAAREAADVVVVAPHWGNEDSSVVTDAQRALARKFVEWGADIVAGTHPHVLQTMEFLPGPQGRQAFVAYSLGNFLSGQRQAPNLVGGVLELTVTKNNVTGEVSVASPKLIPTITHYSSGFSNLRLISWKNYTPALAGAHGARGADSRFNYNWIEELLKRVIPEEFLAL